ncbi:MAG: signal peptidase II [Clostridia bacterium]|nr:signal peptidase II [Clostridia bacterium]
MGEQIKQKKKGELTLKGSWLWGVLLFIILIVIDQVTKIAADVAFGNQWMNLKNIEIIPGHLELCQSYNRGVAFSGMANAPEWAKILLIIGTGLMMAAFAVMYFLIDKRRSFLRVAIVFVVAGGVGNLIDRIYFQVWDPNAIYGVRDMVAIDILFFSAICNFADFFITGGAVMLILAILFFDKEAFFPVGKKYKALAKEAEEEKKAKAKAKRKKSNEEAKRKAAEKAALEAKNAENEETAEEAVQKDEAQE